jgi:cell division protein FtsZ
VPSVATPTGASPATAPVPAAEPAHARPRPIPAGPDDVPASLEPVGAAQRPAFTVVEDGVGEGVTVERPVEVPRVAERSRPAEDLDVPDFLK